ncbi:flagellar hook-length control protein FliK [Shewanella sp. WPAGA9]|uniref:flagellar hook-length control protein FliK n=1 Tax=Shewanella sp. ENK2 TaxID=2775245 RepID=UPI001784877E|nr:flagellar hook-length control protein FliK [Shewanella sp. WPAGA9]
MITNVSNLSAMASHSSSQPFSISSETQSDFEHESQGDMGFVMPLPSSLVSPDKNVVTLPQENVTVQNSAISHIPAHLISEIKQTPYLAGALSALTNEFDSKNPVALSLASEQVKSVLSELSLMQNSANSPSSISPELRDFLALLNQQVSQSSAPSQAQVNQLASGLPNGQQPTSVTTSLAPQSMQPAMEMHLNMAPAAAITPPVTDGVSTELDNINQVINQLSQTAAKTQATSQWGPVSVSQSAPMLQQSNELLSPLRDQLRFQIDQQIKSAELRLDPPELGKVELNIRLDGDRLHIQMHAANNSVRDALQMGLERLRHDLEMEHGGQIDFEMSDTSSEQQHTSRDAIAQQFISEEANQQHEQQDVSSLTQSDSLKPEQVDLLA